MLRAPMTSLDRILAELEEELREQAELSHREVAKAAENAATAAGMEPVFGPDGKLIDFRSPEGLEWQDKAWQRTQRCWAEVDQVIGSRGLAPAMNLRHLHEEVEYMVYAEHLLGVDYMD